MSDDQSRFDVASASRPEQRFDAVSELAASELAASDIASRTALHLLYVLGPRSPKGWLQQTLHQSSAHEIEVRETPLLPTALECLRESAFDVVVIDQDASERSPREVVTALQSGTSELQPIVVFAAGTDRTRATVYLEAGASCYCSLGNTTAQELVWQLHDVRQQSQIAGEQKQLSDWRTRHEAKQHDEILKLLAEQRSIFGFADRLRSESTIDDAAPCFEELRRSCADLLQAYVVMGRGQLANEVRHLASQLHDDQVSLPRLLQCYAAALTDLVQHRGARSARHVFDRGNLLLLDVLLQWADRLSLPNSPLENRVHGSFDHRADL